MFIRRVVIIIFMLYFVNGEASQDRSKQLEKVMGEKTSIRIRALNEIGNNVSIKEYQKLLVEYLFSDISIFYEEAVLNRLLVKADVSLVSQIVDRYKASQKDEIFFKVCVALEKIGGQTEQRRLFYLEESKRIPVSQNKKAWLRVCFVNQGVDLEKNLKQIKLDLSDTNSLIAKEEIRIMSKIGCQRYIDKDIVAALIRGINTNNDIDTACFSAIALASLEKKGYDYIEYLKENTKESICLDDYSDSGDINRMVVNNMCIAAIDEKQLERRVELALHNMGYEYGIDQTSHAVITLLCESLISEPIKKIIENNLSDSDPNIVRGALRFIYCLGFECNGVKSKLIDLLENSEDEQVRGLSARALSMIMDQNESVILEKISKKEMSEDVQKEIRNTMQILKMEPPFTESSVF